MEQSLDFSLNVYRLFNCFLFACEYILLTPPPLLFVSRLAMNASILGNRFSQRIGCFSWLAVKTKTVLSFFLFHFFFFFFWRRSLFFSSLGLLNDQRSPPLCMHIPLYLQLSRHSIHTQTRVCTATYTDLDTYPSLCIHVCLYEPVNLLSCMAVSSWRPSFLPSLFTFFDTHRRKALVGTRCSYMRK